MRIGINTLFMVPGDVGGTEVYLCETLIAMAALSKSPDTLVLFTNKENHSLLQADLAEYRGVEFYRVPCPAAVRPLRIFMEQFFLPFVARKAAVDVLWSPGYTAPALCFSPQAVTVCDLQYKSFPEDMSLLERITLDILVRTACSRCQAVLTISEFSRQEVITYGFAKAEKVHPVLLGVTGAFARRNEAAGDTSQQVQALGAYLPFVLCVAHTYPHKNVDKLIAALALLEDRIPHQLVLVGKGRRGEQAVQEQLQRLQAPNRVIRLQGLAEEDLQALYQEAAVFVLPSTYEGFGLPVLEALMAARPVVTVQAASLPEVGGQYAVYAERAEPSLLADKIMEVLQLSHEERAERGRQGSQWAATFTWERTAAQTLRVLRSITNSAE
ncbi:glycosyltransferase family 4 protein [Candidatus Electrothrix sp.]|uniref:glycosyltransferase family 4 protein n=1 Tax=Candidatus Electrothrix sp. TaxID=2170559 RepID=UPI0040563778